MIGITPPPLWRFIPTHVGNASCCMVCGVLRAVHPHARGERAIGHDLKQLGAGSSPRTWGTPVVDDDAAGATRFIPTHVGNASPSLFVIVSSTVHPHARGERNNCIDRSTACSGSSPRTWGTLLRQGTAHIEFRFIPTHVGNAGMKRTCLSISAVHPHARGERTGVGHLALQVAGSSPRTWGTRRRSAPNNPASRFIPTHVGNAARWRKSAPRWPVHPHARGERLFERLDSAVHIGSSPRTWGTRRLVGAQARWPRFIPTHVGNACALCFRY